MTKEVLRLIINRFAASWKGQLWPMVKEDIRNALIDTLVMDSVRMAHSQDASYAFTPGDLMGLRADLVAALQSRKYRINE